MFDKDELGLDPEDDPENYRYCHKCGETIEDCECEDEEEDDATTGF